jgi:hypothetical protein
VPNGRIASEKAQFAVISLSSGGAHHSSLLRYCCIFREDVPAAQNSSHRSTARRASLISRSLVDADLPPTGGRVRFTVPTSPTLPQSKAGNAGYEVELGREREAQPDRAEDKAVRADTNVVLVENLRDGSFRQMYSTTCSTQMCSTSTNWWPDREGAVGTRYSRTKRRRIPLADELREERDGLRLVTSGFDRVVALRLLVSEAGPRVKAFHVVFVLSECDERRLRTTR